MTRLPAQQSNPSDAQKQTNKDPPQAAVTLSTTAVTHFLDYVFLFPDFRSFPKPTALTPCRSTLSVDFDFSSNTVCQDVQGKAIGHCHITQFSFVQRNSGVPSSLRCEPKQSSGRDLCQSQVRLSKTSEPETSMWKSIYRPGPEVPELVIEPSHRRSLTASLDAYSNADHRLVISALSLSQPCSSTKSILGVQILTLCVAALGQLPSCFCDNFWLCLHKLPCRFVLFKALLEFSSTRFFVPGLLRPHHDTDAKRRSNHQVLLPLPFLVLAKRSADCSTASSSLFCPSLKVFCRETLVFYLQACWTSNGSAVFFCDECFRKPQVHCIVQ